jgi:hypothetical protein
MSGTCESSAMINAFFAALMLSVIVSGAQRE